MPVCYSLFGEHYLFLVAALLLCQNLAADFTVGVLEYSLNTDAKTARVVGYTSDCKGEITIPATVENDGVAYNVTLLGNRCFYNNKDITAITISNSVTIIGPHAFQDCTGLTAIEIPNSVTQIGTSAFSGCASLTSIVFPNSVTSIGANPFWGCHDTIAVVVRVHYCGCKGTTRLQLLQCVFYRMHTNNVRGKHH